MNTLGKILVILNLLFTLVMAAFVIFYSATKNNWYNESVRLKTEISATKAKGDGDAATSSSRDTKYKNVVHERDVLKGVLASTVSDHSIEKTALKVTIDIKDTELKDHKLALTEKEDEIKRRNKAEEILSITLKAREKTILDLDAEKRILESKVAAEKNKADTLAARNIALLEENKRLLITLVKERTGTGGIKTATGPNPPLSLVKGTVDKVDIRNPTLVELTVGSDHGLEVGHTLEAYRLEPEPTYLGSIRISEVHHHSAIGRLDPSAAGRRFPLKSGDKVISDLKAR